MIDITTRVHLKEGNAIAGFNRVEILRRILTYFNSQTELTGWQLKKIRALSTTLLLHIYSRLGGVEALHRTVVYDTLLNRCWCDSRDLQCGIKVASPPTRCTQWHLLELRCYGVVCSLIFSISTLRRKFPGEIVPQWSDNMNICMFFFSCAIVFACQH